MRVLIVDADAGIREILEFLFQHEGWQVDITARTDHALDLAAAHPPGLVVMALKLAPFPPHELIARVRALPGCDSVPVLIFTAASREDVRSDLGDPLPPRVHLLFKGGDPRSVVEVARHLVG